MAQSVEGPQSTPEGRESRLLSKPPACCTAVPRVKVDVNALCSSLKPCPICTNIEEEHKRAVQNQQSNKQPTEAKRCQQEKDWRRHCGCLKTSEKLKELLKCFPSPAPPPPPSPSSGITTNYVKVIPSSHNLQKLGDKELGLKNQDATPSAQPLKDTSTGSSWRSWYCVSEVVQLIQLSVTVTALALYYIIYFYMQLIYYALTGAMFFHNADGPMKITIGVVTITSIVVAFNLMLRMERMVGLHF